MEETDEIADFMAARVDEEEALAEAADPGPWEFEGDDPTDDELCETVSDRTIAYTRGRNVANGRHMERHDPPHVLASVTADRAMLHEHAAFSGIATHDPSVREWANALGRMVRIRASAWAWHSDYKPGWKP